MKPKKKCCANCAYICNETQYYDGCEKFTCDKNEINFVVDNEPMFTAMPIHWYQVKVMKCDKWGKR